MIQKYARKLEEREINPATDNVWSINDVPASWNAKTRAKVEADGFVFLPDGTAVHGVGDDVTNDEEN